MPPQANATEEERRPRPYDSRQEESIPQGEPPMDSSTTAIIIPRPSETEVSHLLQEAAQQYEECMRLADLADISDFPEANHPKYAWDNPIGLVVSG